MLIENPVLIKESRSRFRGKRVFVIETFFLSVLAISFWITYETIRPENMFQGEAGEALFATLTMIETGLVCLIAPAFSCATFTFEREKQTFDLLNTTLLSPPSIIFGKLMSSQYYVFLLIISSIPILSFSLFFGGVSIFSIFAAAFFVLLTALTYGIIGLFFSLVFKRTPASTAATYAVVVFLAAGVPFLAGIFSGALGWLDDTVGLALCLTTPFISIAEVAIPQFSDETTREFGVNLWPFTLALYLLISIILMLIMILKFDSVASKDVKAR